MNQIQRTIQKFKYSFSTAKRLGLKPKHFIVPTTLGFLASGFEAIGMIYLMLLATSIIKLDVASMETSKAVTPILEWFPDTFNSAASIFGLVMVLVVATNLLRQIFNYTSLVASGYVATKFSNSLRQFVFRRYLSNGKLFFDRYGQGNLHQSIIGYTANITESIMQFQGVLSQFCLLIVYTGTLFIISWEITIFAMMIFPVTYLSIRLIIKKIGASSKELAAAQKDMSETISNTIGCIPLVKGYAAESNVMAKFMHVSHKVGKKTFSMQRKSTLLYPIQDIIILIATMILISLMALYVKAGRNPEAVSSFLVYFYALKRASNTFHSLNGIKVILAKMTGPLRGLKKIVQDKNPRYFIKEGSRQMEGFKENVVFRDLTFSYDGHKDVLHDINLVFPKGEMTALVGSSGSGKSTIISLIMRYYNVPDNTLFVDGDDIQCYERKSWLHHVAMVSQEAFIFNDSVKNNLLFGLEHTPSDDELHQVLKKAQLEQVVGKLPQGLDTVLGDRGVQLSGGERQRLSIARAILKEADILILDEATSALDSVTEKLIQEAIHNAIEGKTAIVIAHRLSTIKEANQIVVMKDGRVVEEGKLQELIDKKGEFFTLWKEQSFDE